MSAVPIRHKSQGPHPRFGPATHGPWPVLDGSRAIPRVSQSRQRYAARTRYHWGFGLPGSAADRSQLTDECVTGMEHPWFLRRHASGLPRQRRRRRAGRAALCAASACWHHKRTWATPVPQQLRSVSRAPAHRRALRHRCGHARRTRRIKHSAVSNIAGPHHRTPQPIRAAKATRDVDSRAAAARRVANPYAAVQLYKASASSHHKAQRGQAAACARQLTPTAAAPLALLLAQKAKRQDPHHRQKCCTCSVTLTARQDKSSYDN